MPARDYDHWCLMKQEKISGSVPLRATLLSKASVVALLCVAPAVADEVIDGGSSVTIPGDHASPWDTGPGLVVGDISDGNLNITGGAIVTGTDGTIGSSFTSVGTVTIDGAGSTWTTDDAVKVGDAGDGRLTIRNGGKYNNLHASYFEIGGQTTGIGTIEVSGVDAGIGERSQFITSNRLYIGNAGTGRLDVLDGALASAAYTSSVGEQAGSSGALNVGGVNAPTGLRSMFSVLNNQFWIGDLGKGIVDVTDGGLVLIQGQIGIGMDANSYGLLNVHGVDRDSGLHASVEAQSLIAGISGKGELVVSGGGLVSDIDGYVGFRADSTGVATVIGTGSKWTNNSKLIVGYAGPGELHVRDGGAVYDANGYLGINTGSIGKATVDGADSIWTSATVLGVGVSGTGILELSNGGVAKAGSFSGLARNQGSYGAINIGGAAENAAVAPGWLETNELRFGTGSGHLVFNHTDMSGNYEFAPTISGGNPDSKVDVYSGNTVLTGVNSSYSAATNIYGGILSAGDVDILSANSNIAVASGGRLDMRGHNQIVSSLTNAGNVNFGGAGGTVLTISGNYTANGGTIVLNTVLGDDSSRTDLLHVVGETSGSTSLRLENTGGLGALTLHDGIKVVQVDGVSNGTFSLRGDYVLEGQQVVARGAYGYTLHKNAITDPSDGDWYLRSQLVARDIAYPESPVVPLYQASVPLYETYPQAMLALNRVSTLQQRVGNRYWREAVLREPHPVLCENPAENFKCAIANDQASSYEGSSSLKTTIERNGVWGRIEAAHGRFGQAVTTSGTDYSYNLNKLRAGLDGQLFENESAKLIGGIMVHYGSISTDVQSFFGTGGIDTNGYGLGATLTWYGTNGFYLDAQGQATWYASDIYSDFLEPGRGSTNNGFGYELSVELGQRFKLSESWTLTPQAQLAYSSVDFDSFADPYGARVSLDDGDNLQGRLGLALENQSSWKNDNGQTERLNIYGVVNFYNEFLSGTRVDVSGIKFMSRSERLWGDIGVGGSYNWSDDKYSFYGEVSVNTSLNNFTDNFAIGGMAGLRVKW